MQLRLGTRSMGREVLAPCQEQRALKGKFQKSGLNIDTAVTFLRGVLRTRRHLNANESFAGPLPFLLQKVK